MVLGRHGRKSVFPAGGGAAGTTTVQNIFNNSSGVSLPPLTNKQNRILRVSPDGTAVVWSALGLDEGVA